MKIVYDVTKLNKTGPIPEKNTLTQLKTKTRTSKQKNKQKEILKNTIQQKTKQKHVCCAVCHTLKPTQRSLHQSTQQRAEAACNRSSSSSRGRTSRRLQGLPHKHRHTHTQTQRQTVRRRSHAAEVCCVAEEDSTVRLGSVLFGATWLSCCQVRPSLSLCVCVCVCVRVRGIAVRSCVRACAHASAPGCVGAK